MDDISLWPSPACNHRTKTKGKIHRSFAVIWLHPPPFHCQPLLLNRERIKNKIYERGEPGKSKIWSQMRTTAKKHGPLFKPNPFSQPVYTSCRNNKQSLSPQTLRSYLSLSFFFHVFSSIVDPQLFQSALVSMRIRTQHFKSMRMRIRIFFPGFDDQKFFAN